MRSSKNWARNLVRALSFLIAAFFFVGLGFRGGPIAGFLVVAGAIAVALAPEAMLVGPVGRLTWILMVFAGVLGGGLCMWEALTYSPSPDTRFAIISGVAVLSLAIGFVRILPVEK